MSNLAALSVPSVTSTGARADARTLPLRDCRLHARAEGGVVRYVIEQRFENPHADPLHVTYKLPLPDEAAVTGFRFEIGERTIVGEVDTKAKARERFDDAIVSGHTAALLEEERTTVFTQELGNVPPHTAVVAKITVDARLVYAAIAPLEARATPGTGRGQWELRFPMTVAPRYLGESGRVADADSLTVTIAEVSSVTPRMSLVLDVGDMLPEGRSPESPTHALQCARDRAGTFRVGFGGEGKAPLDRDLVVRWDAALEAASAIAAVHVDDRDDAAYALVTVVPPAEAAGKATPRDLTILLDTSGSMGGEPLEQARRVASALVDRLGDEDTLHLVEFSNDTRSFRTLPSRATKATKADALAWLARLRASGGTEMRTGILRALRDVRPGRSAQVVLVTDGLIGFEREIVSAIFRDNVHGARVHTVGVGSAVNRSLLAPAARAGRGLEIICGVGEDVEPLVTRLLARTGAPLVTGLEVKRATAAGLFEVACAIEKIQDLHAEAPSLIPIRLPREGGTLVLTGRTANGEYRQEIRVVPDGVERPHVRALYGREAVRDVELRLAAGDFGSPQEADEETERLGLAFGIVTKRTSFVAIDSEVTVDPTKASRHEEVAQALPFGMSATGAGLRPASSTTLARAVVASPSMAMPTARPPAAPPPPAPTGAPGALGGAPPKAAPRRAADEGAREAKPEPTRDSFFDRAKKAVFGPEKKRKEDSAASVTRGAPPPAPEAREELREESAKGAAKSEAPPSLHGRLRKLDGDRAVVEVRLADETEIREVRVFLVLASGERIALDLDRTLSTAEGTYGGGMMIRFVGKLVGATRPLAADVTRVEIETASSTRTLVAHF